MHSDCKMLQKMVNKCNEIVKIFKNGWHSDNRTILRRLQQSHLQKLQEEVNTLVGQAGEEKAKVLDFSRKLLAKEIDESKRSDTARAHAQSEFAEVADDSRESKASD
jgi:hypothetical protein